jgi:hypothetical protein
MLCWGPESQRRGIHRGTGHALIVRFLQLLLDPDVELLVQHVSSTGVGCKLAYSNELCQNLSHSVKNLQLEWRDRHPFLSYSKREP